MIEVTLNSTETCYWPTFLLDFRFLDKLSLDVHVATGFGIYGLSRVRGLGFRVYLRIRKSSLCSTWEDPTLVALFRHFSYNTRLALAVSINSDTENVSSVALTNELCSYETRLAWQSRADE